jgi:hypothetical protein
MPSTRLEQEEAEMAGFGLTAGTEFRQPAQGFAAFVRATRWMSREKVFEIWQESGSLKAAKQKH